MGEVTAVPDKFEQIANLPPSFNIDEQTSVRRIVPEDATGLAEIIAKNPDIKKYVTWPSQVKSMNDIVPVLQSHSNQEMAGRYAITHQDMVVGYVGIFPGLQAEEYGMGYFVDQSVRGRGYTEKAVALIMDAAKVNLAPKQIYLQIDPNNTPSVAIATKLDFQPAETVWDPDLELNEQRFRLEVSSE